MDPRGQVATQECALWVLSPNAHTFGPPWPRAVAISEPPTLVLKCPSVLSTPGLSSWGALDRQQGKQYSWCQKAWVLGEF